MDMLATANPCTRARKCQLVPKGKVEDVDGGTGCCPGQIGHHLIYDAWIKTAGCDKYNYDNAPTSCVEGVGKDHGSHKRIHDITDTRMAQQAIDTWSPFDGKISAEGKMSVYDAIEVAADSHQEAFLLSGCDRDCIVAQLTAYYTDACGNGHKELIMKDKRGRVITGSQEHEIL